MNRLQAYRFELKLNSAQQRHCAEFAGIKRYIYNKALALQQSNYAAGKKYLSYASTAKYLTPWRGDPLTPWLKNAPFHTQQQALKDLDRAYSNFFKGVSGFPKPKKKGVHESFRYPDPKQIEFDQDNSRIHLPKLGWIRYRNSRNVLGELRNVTISQSGGKWLIAIQTRREVNQPIPLGTNVVGIDLGINNFAALSSGTLIAPLANFKNHEQRLKKYQRRMSHKVKFSNNWKKEKAKANQIYTDIANARKDFLHKTTTTICKNHALVCIEDLQVSNLSKSSKGTIENPGKNVKAKSGLNKAILDQGWREFRRQLEYKIAWNGGMVIAVPAQYTSQTCPNVLCGHIGKENRKTQAQFKCVSCGYENHADLVGAINILERGLRLLACGDPVKLDWSVKQEPTYTTYAITA
jgi:putative transposase